LARFLKIVLPQEKPIVGMMMTGSVQGMTIFRILRDEDFLRQMLVVIRRFHTTYVRAKKAPPVNMFYDRSEYQVCGGPLSANKFNP
jgi:hypothetical protein